MLKLAWKYMRYYKSQTFAIFASILLTASLLSGISSLIYRIDLSVFFLNFSYYLNLKDHYKYED